MAGKYSSLHASSNIGLRTVNRLALLVEYRSCALFLDGIDQPLDLLCKISIFLHLFGYGSLQGGLLVFESGFSWAPARVCWALASPLNLSATDWHKIAYQSAQLLAHCFRKDFGTFSHKGSRNGRYVRVDPPLTSPNRGLRGVDI